MDTIIHIRAQVGKFTMVNNCESKRQRDVH